MDIGGLAIAMNLSRVQETASIAVMKMVMNNRKETTSQMTEMLKNSAVDPNLGQHLDARA